MRGLTRFLLIYVSAILFLAPIMSVTYAQNSNAKVVVRGWEHADFGRLVFDWSVDVNYTAALEGKNVYVTFNHKIVTDLSQTIENLTNYVTGGIVSADGRTINFALIDDVQLSHFKNGNSIVVDLRKNFKTENRLSSDDPEVQVRIGTHPEYTRMVFDWDIPIEYSVTQESDKVFLWFNQRARISAEKLKNSLPAGYSNPKTGQANNGTEVSLSIPKDVDIRHFLSGNKLVVDFIAKAEQAEQAEQAEAAKLTSPPVVKKEEPVLQSIPTSIPKAPVSTTPPDLNSENTEIARLDDDGPLNIEKTSSPSEPVSLNPAKESTINEAELAEVAKVEPVEIASDNLGPPPVSLAFQWPEEVGAAAFRRGSDVWIVFDRRTTIDLAPLRALGEPLIERIEQLPISGATVLRMRTKDGINPTAKREGFDWVFDFRQQRMAPVQQVTIDAEADADLGPQLLFPSSEPGNIIHLFDPEVGDTLRAATYKDAGFGVKGMRAYPQFQILASAQGVVVEMFADDLLFDRDFSGFHLSSPEGLHISAISPEAPVSTGPQLSSKRMFDFEKWYRPELPNFTDAKRNFSLAIAEVPPEKKNAARLDLARFYVARGMGPDAVGVIQLIEEDEPDIASKPEFRALRGAARYLNREYEDARRDFYDPRLDGFAESAIWRGAVSAKTGDWNTAADQFRSGDSVLRNYPQPLKGRLGLVRTEAALATRDLRTADSWLKELDLEMDQLRRSEQGDVKFNQARIAMTRNDLDAASTLWEELRASNDLRNAVRSDYSLINLGLKQGTMSRHEAIDRLDKLRYRWRGDRFELTVLRRLGEVYLEKDDFFNGLGTMRTAVTYFPNDVLAEKMAEKMTDIFRALYLDEEADRLPPLRALAIYDEFRELTPSGPDGDLMVEKLADRLIDVDLLNRADALLQHQVQFRLQGEEKARVGAKLSLVRLINNDPRGAIEALDNTNFPQIDFDLENDRRRLHAKSYFELGEVQTAVKLLAGDVTEEADMLRRDIFWHEENWTEVTKVLQRLAGDPPGDPEVGIGDERARYILNWAVALLLNEDDEGLKALSNTFGPSMANSSLAETFNFITTPVVGGVSSSLEATIQQLSSGEQFDLFMNNYRQKYLKSASDNQDVENNS